MAATDGRSQHSSVKYVLARFRCQHCFSLLCHLVLLITSSKVMGETERLISLTYSTVQQSLISSSSFYSSYSSSSSFQSSSSFCYFIVLLFPDYVWTVSELWSLRSTEWAFTVNWRDFDERERTPAFIRCDRWKSQKKSQRASGRWG